jgi:ubiquinone/menaquinone biosynthesis C-methylase UbiE
VSHYSDNGLRERVLAALPDPATVEALAPLDQFHIRGFKATRELLRLASFSPGDQVLDVGSGLGGPARAIASATGAHVTGVDLTPEYVELAFELSALVGLDSATSFQRGDVTALPFPDHSFDGAWMQHVNMNIPDKVGLFRELARVLKPGGTLALHEVISREGEVLYPTPWATGRDQSFLVGEGELKSALDKADFTICEWRDDTPAALEWFEESKVQTSSPLSLHLLFGDQSPERFANVYKNLKRGAIGVILATLRSASRVD